MTGISYRDANGVVVHNAERATIADMDTLPFVTDVYKRDLHMEDYFIGYLKHPYVSIYTGRGCKSRCTFCLWPQTVGGHKYRVRSPQNVADEVARIMQVFPQTREVFFDDDTFTDDLPRAEAIAKLLGPMGVVWSCNAKANVPRETLKVLKENGLRLLLVGYESGNQQILHNIKKGLLVDVARRFTKDCHELGIKIHGTFIVGLPGETRETIEETIRYATELNPHTMQVSLAAPYPGTFLHKQAVENGWLDASRAELIDDHGIQIAPLTYPHLSHTEMFDSLEDFYRRFYFRAPKIASIVGEMLTDRQMLVRRLREGREFFAFLKEPSGAQEGGLGDELAPGGHVHCGRFRAFRVRQRGRGDRLHVRRAECGELDGRRGCRCGCGEAGAEHARPAGRTASRGDRGPGDAAALANSRSGGCDGVV